MLGYALIRQHEVDRGAEAWTRGAETPATVLRAREVLERACRGEGVRPWAQYAYARSFLGEEDPAPAIAALERATAVAPWEPRFFELLVWLQVNAGELESARQTFDHELRPRTRFSERKDTEIHLVTRELGIAADAFREGDSGRATLVLVRAFEASESDGIREAVLEQVGRLGLGEACTQYLVAVRLSREGEFAEALTALDAITGPVDEPVLRERVGAMRAELESMVTADLGR